MRVRDNTVERERYYNYEEIERWMKRASDHVTMRDNLIRVASRDMVDFGFKN